jgi:adenylosuccinate lyase
LFGVSEYKYNSDLEIAMIFDDKTDMEIYLSLEAETAKSLSELRCARKDLDQAEVRLRFVLTTIHHLKKRYEDYK